MKKVYLIFSHNEKDWISRTIAWFTFGRWSHVALVTSDKNFVIEASASKKPHGVKKTPLNEWIETHPDYVIKTINHCNPELVEKLCESQLGKPYDWIWMLHWFFRQNKSHLLDKWSCSKLITWAICEAGERYFNCDIHRVTPQMWFDLADDLKEE